MSATTIPCFAHHILDADQLSQLGLGGRGHLLRLLVPTVALFTAVLLLGLLIRQEVLVKYVITLCI